MTAPRDEQLPSDLRAASSPLAAPPAEELEVAKGLFVWRTIDAELAELTHDSLLDGAEGRRTRAAGRPRLRTFQVDGFSIDAEVDAANGARRLIGQIVPPGLPTSSCSPTPRGRRRRPAPTTADGSSSRCPRRRPASGCGASPRSTSSRRPGCWPEGCRCSSQQGDIPRLVQNVTLLQTSRPARQVGRMMTALP